MKKLITIIVLALSLAVCVQAQQRKNQPSGSATGSRPGARMGAVQGASRPADVGISGTVVRKWRDRAGTHVTVNSLEQGDKIYEVFGETKIMKNGYASNWEYIVPGDIVGGILKETGPFLKTLTLTSKPTAVAAAKPPVKVAAESKDSTEQKAVIDPKAKKLFEWHQDQYFRGKVEGTRELGLDYLYGRGIATNAPKGMDLITEAAGKGDEDSKVLMKKMASKD